MSSDFGNPSPGGDGRGNWSGWVFVGLGSNLGDSAAILRAAFDRLQAFSNGPLARSSLWRSDPVDCPPGSPSFLNAVAGLAPLPDQSPESLLAGLQALEREFGRLPKKVLNEPRPLDLDLILWGGVVCAGERLTLPHPRAHLRRFVLQPLAELAPDLRWPGTSRTVRQLLDGLEAGQSVQRVEAPSLRK